MLTVTSVLLAATTFAAILMTRVLMSARRDLIAGAIEHAGYEALRASDESRRRMFADVAHELKAPLTAMRGYAETLRLGLDLDEQTRERYFQTIERETIRLDRIANDLLDLARLENGIGALDVRLFAVERVFEHVVLRHERETRRRDIDVRVSVTAEADQVVADPDRIEQAVDNLFVNALRQASVGGSIELRAASEGDAIVLSVIDSGNRPAIESPDSGLAFAVAKAIVERHHGSLVMSGGPGRTAFTIVLPHQWAEPRYYSTSTNL